MKNRTQIIQLRAGWIFLFLLLVFIPQAMQAQAPDWNLAKAFHTNGPELGTDIIFDTVTGNVIVVGSWENDLSSELAPTGIPSTDFTSTYGNSDGLVMKLDPDGNLIWAFKVGSPVDDVVEAVALDTEGNIYITGIVGQGTCKFTGTGSVATTPEFENTNGSDFFLAKYDPDGVLLWTDHSMGDQNAAGTDLIIDALEIYVVGYAQGTTLFDTKSSDFNYGQEDVFMAKYTLDGSITWLAASGSNNNDRPTAVTRWSNHIVMGGFYSGFVFQVEEEDGNVAASLLNINNGMNDLFLVSMNPGGVINWSEAIQSMGDNTLNDLVTDKTYIYVTGSIANNSNFPSYPNNPVPVSDGQDIFLSTHFISDGNTDWVRVIPCSGNGIEEGTAVAVNDYGNVYMSGYFHDDLNFFGDTLLSADGNMDAFTAKFGETGNFEWAKKVGSTGDERLSGIVVANDIEVYYTGYYENETQMDTYTLPDDGDKNLLVARLESQCTGAFGGTATVSSNEICDGESVLLSLTGHLGTIRWQSSPAGLNQWNDLIPTKNQPTAVETPIEDTDYRAFLTIGKCLPDSSNVVSVLVNPTPEAIHNGFSFICNDGMDTAPIEVTLTGTPPWSFTMLRNGGNDSLFSGITDPTYTIYLEQEGIYTLTNITDLFCSGNSTGSTQVSYYEDPTATIGGSYQVCDDGSSTVPINIDLNGSPSWNFKIEIDGVIDTNLIGISTSNYSFMANKPGIYTLTDLMDSHCRGSATGSADVTAIPLPTATISGDQALCDDGTPATLSVGLTGTPPWDITYTSDQGNTGQIQNINIAIQNFDVDLEGTYFVNEVIDASCSNTGDGTATVDFITVPTANAGRDDAACGLMYNLDATPSVGNGIWTAPVDVTFITSPTLFNAQINVSNYQGYSFKWQETNQICTDEDEVYVTYYEPPSAYAGETQRLDFEFETLLEASLPVAGEGRWNVIEGDGNIQDPSQPSTRVTNLSVGRNLFRWTVSNGPCLPAFDEVVVFVEDLVIPNIVTPNGDGKNDYFMIPGLEKLEPPQLTIYNRWGNLVYETGNYMNDWEGYNQEKRELPNDTYFYTLILSTGGQYTGYITLRK